jgi:hypothetical protein
MRRHALRWFGSVETYMSQKLMLNNFVNKKFNKMKMKLFLGNWGLLLVLLENLNEYDLIEVIL